MFFSAISLCEARRALWWDVGHSEEEEVVLELVVVEAANLNVQIFENFRSQPLRCSVSFAQRF